MPPLPDWLPLDRLDDAPPSRAANGGVVGIVASRQAVEAGWAAAGAIEMARSWSAAGHRVMLVDAALDQPSLHRVLEVPNDEGLSDAVLYGASVGRVTELVESGPFFFMPSGTAVADVANVVAAARWAELVQGFVEAGVTLGLYLREDTPGAEAVLGSAAEITVLAHSGDPTPATVGDLEPLVTLVTGPSGPPPTPDLEPEPTAVSAGSADTGSVPAKAGDRTRVLVLVLLVVVLAVVALGLFGIVDVPGITPLGGVLTPVPSAGPSAIAG